jgi:PAS domain S-box-containing protein
VEAPCKDLYVKLSPEDLGSEPSATCPRRSLDERSVEWKLLGAVSVMNDREHPTRRPRRASYIVDRTGHVTAWSREAEAMKGYLAAEVIGLSASKFFTPEDRASALPELELVDAIGGTTNFARRSVRRDGATFLASVQVIPLYSSGGHTAFLKVITDCSCLDDDAVAEMLRFAGAQLHDVARILKRMESQRPDRLGVRLEALSVRLAELEAILRPLSRKPCT